jgi:hypothetical protein
MSMSPASTTVDLFGGAVIPAGDRGVKLTPTTGAVPAGFDAVVQLDRSLLEAQLRRNLLHEGLSVLDASSFYDHETAPPGLRAFVESPQRPTLPFGVDRLIELRLTNPRLTRLRSELGTGGGTLPPIEDIVATTGKAAPVTDAAASDRSLGVVETTWTVELNLLLRTTGTETDPSAPGSRVQLVTDLTAAAPARSRETRERIAVGSARVPATTVRVRRHDRGQFWVRIHVGALEPRVDSDDKVMLAVFASDLGFTLLQTALAPLVDDSGRGLRLTPRIALAGSGETLPGPALQMHPLVLQHSDGRELLSLCVDAGIGSPGSPELVQSFLGEENFAYYLSGPVAERVIGTRWRSKPGLRTIVGDVPVELAEAGNPEQTHEGLARIRLRLADSTSTVDVRPSEGDFGDPLRLVSEQEIQLLNLWDHEGNEITDLGELGQPATQPFVWLIYLFDRDPAPQVTSPAKRALRRLAGELTGPVVRPFVEKLVIQRLSGATSSALGAIVVRAELRQPQLGPTGPLPPPPPDPVVE